MKEKIELIEIGCMLFAAIYHFILFFQIRKRHYIYLSLIVFAVFVRALLVDDGSGLMFELFQGLSKLSGRKIEYLAAYATLPLILLFINELFSVNRLKKVSNWLIYIGFGLMLIVLVSPYSFYRQTLNVYHVGMLSAFIVVLIAIYQAMKSRETGANYIFLGIVLCFAFVLVEMIKNSRVIPYFETSGPNLVNTGLIVFFFFQSIALSFIYAKSFKENELLNKDLETRVSERTEELSQSNVIKERFIRIVSHDLRAPLNNLKSAVGLIKDGIIKPEQSEELFKRIDGNLSESLGMLDDLMDWTKATSDSNFRIFKENFELSESVASVVDSCSQELNNKKIRLKNSITGNLQIHSDRNALKVIFRNLLTNAIKFSYPDSEVHIFCEKKEQFFLISVADQGIGIPDEMRDTIFEMDSRNNRGGTNNEKSTGVGLSICKDLVVQNGGEITVDANAPTGSIFRFTVEVA